MTLAALEGGGETAAFEKLRVLSISVAQRGFRRWPAGLASSSAASAAGRRRSGFSVCADSPQPTAQTPPQQRDGGNGRGPAPPGLRRRRVVVSFMAFVSRSLHSRPASACIAVDTRSVLDGHESDSQIK